MSSHLSGIQEDTRLYQEIKGDLLPDFEGQFVLIKDGKMIDVYPTYQAALDAATKQFGAPVGDQYLYTIKEITRQDVVETI